MAKNLLGNVPNQPFKLKTKKWLEINDDARGTYNTNNQTKFKTAMLKLRDYSEAYILVKGNITVANTAVIPAAANNLNKKVIFKNCPPFTD